MKDNNDSIYVIDALKFKWSVYSVPHTVLHALHTLISFYTWGNKNMKRSCNCLHIVSVKLEFRFRLSSLQAHYVGNIEHSTNVNYDILHDYRNENKN